jgi:hypothetical protein
MIITVGGEHMTPDIQALVERIEKLESHNRRMKQMGAGALLALSALFLTAQAASHRIEASDFVLRGVNGELKGVLSTVDGNPTLWMGRVGKGRILIGVDLHHAAAERQERVM